MKRNSKRLFYKGTIVYSESDKRYYLHTGVKQYKLYDGFAKNVFTNTRISEFGNLDVVLEGTERAPQVLNVYSIRRNK